MTEQKDEQISKRVEFKSTDDSRQVATGVVMVPGKVDLQGDWERPETIRNFADDFMARLSNGDGPAEGGVMHAVWPGDDITLVENTVLDESREIGGKEYPAGTWAQSWRFNDDELWSLVDDGVLGGYSIGAREVQWGDPKTQEDLEEDIDVSTDYPDDEPVRELKGGTIVEVSAVDIPAVPDAQILATKADESTEKRLSDHLGNRDAFIEEARDRGHSEENANRLWNYLSRAAENGGTELEADAPDGVLQRVGKAALKALSGSSGEDEDESEKDEEPEKEGRTLSRSNRDSLYASIDASLDILEDSGVDHGMTRFTDREDVAFSLSDHTARDWPTPDEGGEGDTGPDIPPMSHAADKSTTSKQDVGDAVRWDSDAGGEREPSGERYGVIVDGLQDEDEDVVLVSVYQPDSDYESWEPRNEENTMDVDRLEVVGPDGVDSLPPIDQVTSSASTSETTDTTDTTMSDESTDPFDDAPEWAKSIHEQTEKNSERIEEALSEDKSAEEEEKGAFDEAPEWAKALKEQSEKNADRIDAISKQTGATESQQLGKAAEEEKESSDFTLDPRKAGN